MKKIKQNIARTFAFIGKLTAFSLLCFVSFGVCCLLGSWTTNDNDDTYYDNYYSYNDYGFVGEDVVGLSFDSSNLYSVYTNNTRLVNSNLPILDFLTDASLNTNVDFYLFQNSIANNDAYITFNTEINDLYDIVDTLYISFFYLTSIDTDTNTIWFDWYSDDNINLTSPYELASYNFNTSSIASNGVNVSSFSCLQYYSYTNLFSSDDEDVGYNVYYLTFAIYKNSNDEFMYLYIHNDSASNSEIFGVSPFTISSSPFTPIGLVKNYISKDKFDTLEESFNNLQDEYNSLESQANEWYLQKRYYENAYNELANTIDFGNYYIDLVKYNTTDTLSNNYTVLYTIEDISDLIVSNSYLDVKALIRYVMVDLVGQVDASQINGFIINSSVSMSINQYNMLFNAISSPNYYIGLYYSNSNTSNQFVSYPLKVNTDNGYDYYFNSYSLYDVLKTQGFDNLFSDFTYNKLAIHLTNASISSMTINNIKLNSENGYNTGYSKGLLDSANTIASLQDNVNTLEIQKESLNQRIDYLQRQLDNNLGWHSLFFSMADTPIKVVGGFLDYEILGINLFKALLGILTALAVIWLIKRFTR